MIDHRLMKLGKLPARFKPQTLRMGRYLLPDLPPPPSSCDWTGGVKDWGMMLNGPNDNPDPYIGQGLGCCTISKAGHAIQTWTLAATGTMVTITDRAILSAYEQWDGFDPNYPTTTDNGGELINVETEWRKDSTIFGHGLDAFVQPAPQNHVHIQQAIALFGGVDIGLILPRSAQQQDVWNVTAVDGGMWGGHDVWCNAYEKEGIVCVTWGKLKMLTWAFWDKYCDESMAMLSLDWRPMAGRTEYMQNLNWPLLESNLAQVTN